MRSADRRLFPLVLLLAGLLPLLMASRATSSTVIVREGDILDEDLFAGAISVRVSGAIEGDLVATVWQTATVDGLITGDVVIIGSQVDISGEVEGGVRIVADVINIEGSVGDDAFLIGRTVRVSGTVGRDLVVWAVDSVVSGQIERETAVTVLDDAVLSGQVGAGTEIIAGSIRFENGATFGSGVRARSDDIEGADLVDGRVTVPSDLPVPLRVRALLVTAVLAGVALMIGLWLSVFWLAPATVQTSIEIADREPVRALVNGFWVLLFLAMMLIGPPLIGLIGFPQAALGVYVFGGPLLILFAALVLTAWFVGAVPAATAFGRRVVPRASPLSAFVLGAMVLALLMLVPFVRWLVPVVLTAGVGALWLGAGRNRGSTDWLRLPPKAEAGRRPEAGGWRPEAADGGRGSVEE